MSILEDATIESGRVLVQEGGSFKNIIATTTNSATLYQVKTSGGFLHAIIVNSTAAGAVTIYDNTALSGTKIGTLKASIAERTYIYNVKFDTGLSIDNASNMNLTVVYR